MLRLSLTAALLASAAMPALADDVSTNPMSAPKGKYKVEPNHTSVLFCIRHNGISGYCGRFAGVTGTLSFNGSQPEKSALAIDIDVNSLDTPSDKLDAELKSGFFETAKFPTATFKSTAIKVTGKNEGEITGDLTLHGVTKPVTLKTTFGGGKMHAFANTYVVGFSASAKIKHADFAFPNVAWRSFVGDEVTLTIETEMLAEK
ncbi:MAG: YceI family protein [Alphaproteobacteria bacterium]|nr:YceI family protein [Alphaproteobacteria bacterium]